MTEICTDLVHALVHIPENKYCKQNNLFIMKRLCFVICGLDGTRTRDPMRDRHVF